MKRCKLCKRAEEIEDIELQNNKKSETEGECESYPILTFLVGPDIPGSSPPATSRNPVRLQ